MRGRGARKVLRITGGGGVGDQFGDEDADGDGAGHRQRPVVGGGVSKAPAKILCLARPVDRRRPVRAAFRSFLGISKKAL